MSSQRGADLDQRAYELRQQGLTYRAIAKWLAVARRRVLRHERTLRVDWRVSRAAPPELCLASPR